MEEFEKVLKQYRANTIKVIQELIDKDEMPRILWNMSGTILYCNSKFANPLGYTKNELMGRKFFNEDGTSDFICEEYVQESLDIFSKNTANGFSLASGYTNKWYNKAGEKVPIMWGYS